MRYFTFLTATLPFLPISHATAPPKPKPKPGPPTPIINATALLSPRSVDQVIPTQSQNSFFGSDLSANEFLTAISGDTSFSVYATSKSHKWNSPIETVEYSSRETITSLTVCGNVVAVAITTNLCDDNFLNCQIMNPQLSFFRVKNNKISSIKSYGGSSLHDSLSPSSAAVAVDAVGNTTAPAGETIFLMKSLDITCSDDAVIVTSSWRDINATLHHQTSYGAILGTELSSAFTSPVAQQYQFDRLDFNGLIPSESDISVAMSDTNVMVASLSTSSASASPVTHFFSFDFPVMVSSNGTTASSSSSSALFHICSLSGNPELPMNRDSSPAASSALSTALNLDTAVLGLFQLSEVYVYTRSSSSSDPSLPYLWTAVGILRASDSFLGDLFGYSVFVSTEAVIVGAPQALSSTSANNNATRVDRTGAVYVYRHNVSTGRWFEEKIVKDLSSGDGSSSCSSSIQSAFGSHISGTSSALFFSDVPMSLSAALGLQEVSSNSSSGSSSSLAGQVFILWTDSSSSSGSGNGNGNDNQSQWKSTIMWALVLVSIPVAVAFALVGFKYRSSLFGGETQEAILVPGTPSSSSNHPSSSPFLLTSCVESSASESGATATAPAASILHLSPLFPHVLRSSALPAKTSKRPSDVESNCSTSPGQQRAPAAKWRLGGVLGSGYHQLSVPDSPSCRSEVSTVSLDSTSEVTGTANQSSTWLSRLSNAFQFSSVSSAGSIDDPLPSLTLRGLTADVDRQRSALQSPHPAAAPTQQQSQTPQQKTPATAAASNPMTSPVVAE